MNGFVVRSTHLALSSEWELAAAAGIAHGVIFGSLVWAVMLAWWIA